MRVLYVNQWAGLGGAEISLLRVMERVCSEGVQPVLACPPGALTEEARALGIEVLPVNFPSLRSGGRPSAQDMCRLQQAIESCQVVHAYSVRAGWFAGRLCRRLNVPMVWSIHDLFSRPWQRFWLQMVAWRYAQAVVAYSQVLRNQLGRWLAEKVHLIPHGVDVERFAPLSRAQRTEMRRQMQTPPDAPVVLHVGRLMPFKGQHLFLEMAHTLLTNRNYERIPIFWLTGDDSMGDRRYAQKVREMSRAIEPSVRWLGFRRDIAPIIASADVLVHCSTRPEPFGLVIPEAWACGTAVVSANRGAPAELIEHGRTGILSPPGHVLSLAQCVHDLLTDEHRRHAMTTAGRRVVCERYTIQQHTQQVVRLYRCFQ